MQPTAQFETVTPMMAKRWLESNTNNRPVNEYNLDLVVMEMNRQNFHITGESIKFAEDGSLLDGQHRLLAIVKSGQSVKMLIVRGLEKAAFKYIDTGRKRNAGDVLGIEGVKNPSQIASIVKFVISFNRGQYSAATYRITARKSTRITNADISEFFNKNKADVYDSYPYGFNRYNKVIQGTTLAAFHFLFKKINDVQADDFCHKVATGDELAKDSPILLLRQRLLADIRATRKMQPVEKIAILCKSWNLYRAGKKVSILKWDSIKEPFPKPI